MPAPYEVDCNILWHHYSADGRHINSSMTHLVGNMHHLQERIRKSEVVAETNRKAGREYYIAAQIIPNRVPA